MRPSAGSSSVTRAAKTVIQTLQMGIPLARSELLCATTMKALNAYSKLGYREAPTLFLEFHGTEAAVVEQAVHKALEAKRLTGDETLAAKVTLEIPSLGVKVPFEGEIKLK